MKNLVVQQDWAVALPLEAGEQATTFCTHAAEQCGFVATSFLDVICINFVDGKALWRCALGHLSQPDSRVSGMAYSLELDGLAMGLSTGELLLLQCTDQQVEEVGALEGGVVRVAWSPDGGALAVLSGAGRLLLMDQQWEVQAEVGLAQGAEADAGGCSPEAAWLDAVLTWRGDGKFLATSHKTIKNGAEERVVQVWERDGLRLHATGEHAPGWLPVLAWQPNGRHIYTVHVPPAAPATAPATTGPLAGTPNNPKGVRAAARMAAATAELPIQSSRAALVDGVGSAAPLPRVLLLERNGLQHGGFDLPSAGHVVCLAWSADSELLAVAQQLGSPAAAGQQPCWVLQVWHRSNWHWYLKSERRYTGGGGGGGGDWDDPTAAAPLLAWDDQAPGRLHVVSATDGVYEQLSFVWGNTVSDLGTAVVVDGAALLLTPMRHALVPPPMCAARAVLPSPPAAVGVSSSCGGGGSGGEPSDERIAALLADGRLALMRSVEDDLWEETLQEQQQACASAGLPVQAGLQPLLASLPPDALPPAARVRALEWLGPDRLLLLASAPAARSSPAAEADQGRSRDVMVEVALVWPPQPAEWDATSQAGCQAEVVATEKLGKGVLVQLSTGELRLYTCGGTLAALPAMSSFKEPCSWLVAAPPAPTPSGPPHAMVQPPRAAFGLTAGGGLYWGGALLAPGVTSCALRKGGPGGPALMYVTRKSLLYTVHLSQLYQGGYTHRELTEEAVGAVRHTVVEKNEMRAAMHVAMRPLASLAAARDTTVRSVEQGAMLLAAPQDGISVVMQMPRGNLEGIVPRAFVLAAIAEALSSQRFAEAWDLATTHRVDLNLLVDWGWPAFLPAVPAFVAAVPIASDLCDFLAALRPDSVVAPGGLYANIPVAPPRRMPQGPTLLSGDAAPGGKVNAVCAAVREAVQAQLAAAAMGAGEAGTMAATPEVGLDGVARALPTSAAAAASHELLAVVVTSHARCDPPELEAALTVIREAKEASLRGPKGEGDGRAERALRALLLHVDVDVLYRAALGLYDLPLAFMVVNHGQKDPGEYLVELQRLAGVKEAELRRHAVDVLLGRWDRALRHLMAAGPDRTFKQALTLAKERGLLRLLLALLDEQAPPGGRPTANGSTVVQSGLQGSADGEDAESRRRTVLQAIGDGLWDAGKAEDAGMAYMAAGALEQALKAYRAAHQWQQTMIVACRLGYDKPRIQRLASDMSEELAAAAQPAAAAALLLHYLEDVDNSVSLLTKAKEWREALRVAYQHQRQDLVTTVVAPAAAEAATALLSEAKDARAALVKYGTRWRDVRAKRQALAAAVLAAADGEAGVGPSMEEVADAQSDTASTLLTGMSLYTVNTHTGATGTQASSRAPSTVGGRKAQKALAAQERTMRKVRQGKIRQGTPEEEASLVAHLLTLGPPNASLLEGGALAELLLGLGHERDARTLQAALTAWQAEHRAMLEELRANPVPADSVPDGFQHILRLYDCSPGDKAPGLSQTEAVWKWDVLRPPA